MPTTSLSRQLSRLRADGAGAIAESTLTSRASLLFERKEAQALGLDQIWKIAADGVRALAKIDGSFSDPHFTEHLYEEQSQNVQRATLTKDENDKLNARIEKVALRLAPYLQHSAGLQALEWLVAKFDAHLHVAEFLLYTLLPFHETAYFTRLVTLLRLDDIKDALWSTLKTGAKQQQQAVPFAMLARHALAGSENVATKYYAHIERAAELIGSEYLERTSGFHFVFLVKLLVAALSDVRRPLDDAAQSKLVPMLANGLRSPLLQLRYVSLIVLSHAATTLRLTEPVVQSFAKLLLVKIRPDTMQVSLKTLLVLFQQQALADLTDKSITKLMRKEPELGAFGFLIDELDSKTDCAPMAKIVFKFALAGGHDPEISTRSMELTKRWLDTSTNGRVAAAFLDAIVSALEQDPNGNLNNSVPGLLGAAAARFAADLQPLATKHKETDVWKRLEQRAPAAAKLIAAYEASVERQLKKKRKRASSQSSERDQERQGDDQQPKQQQHKPSVNEALKKMRPPPERPPFKGDPVEKLAAFRKKALHKKEDEIKAALAELEKRGVAAWKNALEEDLEAGLFVAIRGVQEGLLPSAEVTAAFTKAPLSADLVLQALGDREDGDEGKTKRARTSSGGGGPDGDSSKVLPEDETVEKREKRIRTVLDLLNSIDPKEVPVSQGLLLRLFELAAETAPKTNEEEEEPTDEEIYRRRLALTTLARYLESGKFTTLAGKPLAALPSIVESVRASGDGAVRREALRVLGAAVRIEPDGVLSHALALFTFVGSRLLRRDDAHSMAIFEQAVRTIFGAIRQKDGVGILPKALRSLATAVQHVAAHRREPLGRALAQAIGPKVAHQAILALAEAFVLRWQKGAPATVDAEPFEDVALAVCASLRPPDQLACVAALINEVVAVGGDESTTKPPRQQRETTTFLDRTQLSLPKLRHYRFVLLGWMARLLESKILLRELAAEDDDKLLASLRKEGRAFFAASSRLDRFVAEETRLAEKASEKGQPTQAQGDEGGRLRYWIALTARTDTCRDRAQSLLPLGVAIPLIADLLNDATDVGLRERTLQLLNAKLTDTTTEEAIDAKSCAAFAATLNKWLVPATTHEERRGELQALLCQHAAFSLRLLARRLVATRQLDALAESVRQVGKILAEWRDLDDTLVGNVLLLSGELTRAATADVVAVQARPFLATCLAVLRQQVDDLSDEAKERKEKRRLEMLEKEGSAAQDGQQQQDQRAAASMARRQRIRQQSLSGRRLGGETLLICALTCTQRLLDRFAPLLADQLPLVLVLWCRLAARLGLPERADSQEPGPENTHALVQHRLWTVRRALLRIELRTAPDLFATTVAELDRHGKAQLAGLQLFAALLSAPTQSEATVRVTRAALLRKVLVPAFELRAKLRDTVQPEALLGIEAAAIEALLAIIDRTTEVEAHQTLEEIWKWADKALDQKQAGTIEQKLRVVTALHVAKLFYDRFNALALPHLNRPLDMVPDVLRRTNAATTSKEDLLFPAATVKDSVDAADADLAIRLALQLVANVGRHAGCLTEERATTLVEPLVAEAVNFKVSGHEARAVPLLADALYHVAENHVDAFGDLLSKLLLQTRTGRSKARLRVLQVLERLADRVGDALAPHLPLVMPFVSELLEDDNAQVEAQCDAVLRTLQKHFGQQIADGFV